MAYSIFVDNMKVYVHLVSQFNQSLIGQVTGQSISQLINQSVSQLISKRSVLLMIIIIIIGKYYTFLSKMLCNVNW